jgi:hypothetical protein
MHMHSPPSQGNFCDEHRKVVKPATVQNYAWYTRGIRRQIWPHHELLLYYQTDLEMDKEAILPCPIPYHSQQLYHSHLLWFNIITPTTQADTGEGPNTRGGKGALTSDCKTRKTSPIHQPTKMTWHNRHWLTQCQRIQCCGCFTKNKETRTQTSIKNAT